MSKVKNRSGCPRREEAKEAYQGMKHLREMPAKGEVANKVTAARGGLVLKG
ncbi:MAG: hypothetical protein WBQ89_10955 [Candidatus Acidiferrum sp.]